MRAYRFEVSLTTPGWEHVFREECMLPEKMLTNEDDPYWLVGRTFDRLVDSILADALFEETPENGTAV